MSKHTLHHIGDVAASTLADLKYRQAHPKEFAPIPTNLKELDDLIVGVTTPMIFSIGGRDKRCKSTLAQHMAAVLASSMRLDVAYFQLEESMDQLATRLMVRQSSVADRNNIRALEVPEKGWRELEAAVETLRVIRFWVNDTVAGLDDIFACCEEKKIKVVIIDYSQLMEGGEGKNESDRLAFNYRRLVKAKRLGGYTFIVVYQLNDKGEALGSRAPNRDSDICVEVDFPKDKSKKIIPGLVNITVTRSRFGPAFGVAKVGFDGAHNRLYSNVVVDLSDMGIEVIGGLNDEGDQSELFGEIFADKRMEAHE